MAGKWKPKSLSSSDLKSIAAAVARAEEKSDGEIVPMLVSRSTLGRSAEWLAAALLFIVSEPLLLLFELSRWEFIAATCAAAVVSFLLPPLLFRIFPTFHRVLLHPDDLTAAVEMRAMLELENIRVRHTHKRTGVLIFVSWFERQAVVLGDEGISEKISADAWQSLVTELARDMKAHQVKVGFEKAILAAGLLLNQHFPASTHNPNEIHNDLIIRD